MSAYYTGARKDDEQSIATIRRAIDLGVTLIDTEENAGADAVDLSAAQLDRRGAGSTEPEPTP